MKYKTLRNLVVRKYKSTVKNETTYFMDKSGRIVATENLKHNLLVMYVYCDSNTINNHNDTVAVAVAKDFKLIHNYEVHVADVMIMTGLCGSFNTIERKSNMLLHESTSIDIDFDFKPNNFVEPVQIIDRGILDNPQFANSILDEARIDVIIKDANGTIAKVPYIVGKGLVFNPKPIGTMGYMKTSTTISLDIGLEVDLSALKHGIYLDRRDSHVFSSSRNLVYGILSYKRPSRMNKKKNHIKYIQKKDYTVITSTGHVGTNYHKIASIMN